MRRYVKAENENPFEQIKQIKSVIIKLKKEWYAIKKNTLWIK